MRLIATTLLLACVCGCTGCQAAVHPPRDPFEAARVEGVPVANPLELSPDAAREARARVRLDGTATERAARLVRWLGEGRAEFRYAHETKSAREAYATRQGDCFSVTNMFVAFARYLGIDARFAYVREVAHYLADDSYYATSHLAAVVVEGARVELVDFERARPDYLLASYRVIPDTEAIALFNSNLVMDDLSPGRLEQAERVLRFFARTVPSLPEVENNLAVVLLRRGKVREALSRLRDASARFPDYGPLFANGLLASLRLEDDEAARVFARGGEEAGRRDPVFAFAQGVRLFRAGQYEQALDYFERAQDEGRRSPLVWSYVVRTQMALGTVDSALVSFSRAWAEHPGDAYLEQVRDDFPALSKADTP